MSFDPIKVLVSGVMSREVATISADASVEDAARVMVGNRVSGMPVVDVGGLVVGVVTLTDVVTRLRAGSLPPQVKESQETVFYDAVDVSRLHESLLQLGGEGAESVRAIASSRLLSVSETASVHEASRIMSEHRVHRLLVTDADGRLAGIISALDIVALIARS